MSVSFDPNVQRYMRSGDSQVLRLPSDPVSESMAEPEIRVSRDAEYAHHLQVQAIYQEIDFWKNQCVSGEKFNNLESCVQKLVQLNEFDRALNKIEELFDEPIKSHVKGQVIKSLAKKGYIHDRSDSMNREEKHSTGAIEKAIATMNTIDVYGVQGDACRWIAIYLARHGELDRAKQFIKEQQVQYFSNRERWESNLLYQYFVGLVERNGFSAAMCVAHSIIPDPADRSGVELMLLEYDEEYGPETWDEHMERRAEALAKSPDGRIVLY